MIWDWPHYEEPLPDRAICTACSDQMERDARDEADRQW
jgi:hypothetical protein